MLLQITNVWNHAQLDTSSMTLETATNVQQVAQTAQLLILAILAMTTQFSKTTNACVNSVMKSLLDQTPTTSMLTCTTSSSKTTPQLTSPQVTNSTAQMFLTSPKTQVLTSTLMTSDAMVETSRLQTKSNKESLSDQATLSN